MLERLRQYSIIYSIGLALFFFFWIFPPWLATVWPLFSPEPFPTWLANFGWVGMSQVLSAILLAIATISTIGLLSAILYAVRQHRIEVGWLEAIADEDNASMESRVLICPEGSDVSFLHSTEPYITIRVRLINISVYVLTIDSLKGKLDIYSDGPKSTLEKTPQIENDSRELRHVHPYRLILRQDIQTTTAKRIIAEDKATIGGGNVAVCCTYTNRAGEKKSIRIPLNDIRLKVPLG